MFDEAGLEVACDSPSSMIGSLVGCGVRGGVAAWLDALLSVAAALDGDTAAAVVVGRWSTDDVSDGMEPSESTGESGSMVVLVAIGCADIARNASAVANTMVIATVALLALLVAASFVAAHPRHCRVARALVLSMHRRWCYRRLMLFASYRRRLMIAARRRR